MNSGRQSIKVGGRQGERERWRDQEATDMTERLKHSETMAFLVKYFLS